MGSIIIQQTKSSINDFNKDLEWSQAQSHNQFWEVIYKKAFPNMVNMMSCPGNFVSQRMGIDRVILLSSGKTIKIDEKKRREAHADILLEYLSNDQTGALGWIEKNLAIDYLAYAFIATEVCYLFDWPMLKLAWTRFKDDWMSRYTHIPAINKGYTTWNVAIPIQVLLDAISNTRIIRLH